MAKGFLENALLLFDGLHYQEFIKNSDYLAYMGFRKDFSMKEVKLSGEAVCVCGNIDDGNPICSSYLVSIKRVGDYTLTARTLSGSEYTFVLGEYIIAEYYENKEVGGYIIRNQNMFEILETKRRKEMLAQYRDWKTRGKP